MKSIYLGAFLLLGISLQGAPLRNPIVTTSLVEAIKSHDIEAVTTALERGADVNARAQDGSTPLMAAALYSNTSMMRLLLSRHANVNAADNAGLTALHLAAGRESKVRLLLSHGADVNARTKLGRTPLHVAALVDGGYRVVKLLLDRGAQPDAKAEDGATPLIGAAGCMDVRSLRLLLDRKPDVNAKEGGFRTPLMAAAMSGSVESAKLLLAAGANPNEGSFFGLPTVLMPAITDDTEFFRLLASKGGNLKIIDPYGNSALHWAAVSEKGNAQILEGLLKAGLDVNAKNKRGETALDIAIRHGRTPAVELLEKAGAIAKAPAAVTPEAGAPVEPRVAVERALGVLQKGAIGFSKKAACSSCHNQALPMMAAKAASEYGVAVDKAYAESQTTFTQKSFGPLSGRLVEGIEAIPDMPVTGSYTLLGLAAGGYARDHLTTAAVHHLALRQLSDGRWNTFAPRPPMEYSDITATALTLRALQLYGPEGRGSEFRHRIERARDWLRQTHPQSTEEHAMKLLGLTWSQAPKAEIDRTARSLQALQRADGGWSQIDTLGTDAYATGQALTALHASGALRADAPGYQRGVRYLLKNQQADGSWFVSSRAIPLQPSMDSGFPHGANQWISSAATSWSTIAILNSLEPARNR